MPDLSNLGRNILMTDVSASEQSNQWRVLSATVPILSESETLGSV